MNREFWTRKSPLRQWTLWIILPVAVLSAVIDLLPWPGSMETLIFVVLVLVWGVYFARTRLDS